MNSQIQPSFQRFGQEYSYRIETIKGPTEYNATNLPTGLEVDSMASQIFGTPTATGEFNSEYCIKHFRRLRF